MGILTVAVSRLWTRFSARAAGRSRCASGLCPKLSFFAQDSVCSVCRDKEAALSRETRLAKQIEQLESTYQGLENGEEREGRLTSETETGGLRDSATNAWQSVARKFD